MEECFSPFFLRLPEVVDVAQNGSFVVLLARDFEVMVFDESPERIRERRALFPFTGDREQTQDRGQTSEVRPVARSKVGNVPEEKAFYDPWNPSDTIIFIKF